MTPYFPPELVSHVLSVVNSYYCDWTKTLLACSVVCRAWRPIAQEKLLFSVRLKSEKDCLGVIKAAGKVRGGWKCDLLDTGGVPISLAREVFNAARSIRSINLFVRRDSDYDSDSSEIDVFGSECMSGQSDDVLRSVRRSSG